MQKFGIGYCHGMDLQSETSLISLKILAYMVSEWVFGWMWTNPLFLTKSGQRLDDRHPWFVPMHDELLVPWYLAGTTYNAGTLTNCPASLCPASHPSLPCQWLSSVPTWHKFKCKCMAIQLWFCTMIQNRKIFALGFGKFLYIVHIFMLTTFTKGQSMRWLDTELLQSPCNSIASHMCLRARAAFVAQSCWVPFILRLLCMLLWVVNLWGSMCVHVQQTLAAIWVS